MSAVLYIDWLWIFLLGLCFGSFGNVLVFRLPQMLVRANQDQVYDLFLPRSHCIHCQKTIPWYHNIPLLSWLLLGGVSRCCGEHIPARYPAIELFGGAIFVLAFWFSHGNVLLSLPVAIAWLLMGVFCAQFLEFRHLSAPLLYVLLWHALLLPTIDSRIATLVPAHLYFPKDNATFIQLIATIIGLGVGATIARYQNMFERDGLVALFGASSAWFGWYGLFALAFSVVYADNRRANFASKQGRHLYAPRKTILSKSLQALPRARLDEPAMQIMQGDDWWRAWEFSWLCAKDIPHYGVLQIRVPAESPMLVESKSLKIFLFSLRTHRFSNKATVCSTIERELSMRLLSPVSVQILEITDALLCRSSPDGVCVDDLKVGLDLHGTAKLKHDVLHATGDSPRSETLYTNMFRTLCPLTSQPDWATICVRYLGAPIDRESLLRYLLSYSSHHDFHEHCIEQIFRDIWRGCSPKSLMVEGFFLRRGGIDITPRRFSGEDYQKLRVAPKPLMRQ